MTVHNAVAILWLKVLTLGLCYMDPSMKMTLEGSPSAIVAMMKKLSCGSDEDEPEKQPPPGKPSEKEPERPLQCRAIKGDGARCRHTSKTANLINGLCHSHRRWRELGRPLAN